MKWNETTASRCRYGRIAERLFGGGDVEILWENSDASYQGHAYVLAKCGSEYGYYGWTYGSCPCCDSWEAANTSADDIEAEMRQQTRWMSREALQRYGEALANDLDESYYNYRLKEAIFKELGLQLPQKAEEEQKKTRGGSVG